MEGSEGVGAEYEVRRGARVVVSGNGAALVRAAETGRIRWSDRIHGPGTPPEGYSPHAVPELAPHVPGPAEARARRRQWQLRALLAVLGGLAALLAGATILAGTELGPEFMGLAALVLFLLMPELAQQRRLVAALANARSRGIIAAPAQPTSGDPRLDALLRRRPVATVTLTAIVVASSVAAWALQLAGNDVLYAWFEKDNAAILDGQVWRLVTVALVHAPLGSMGIAHLGFNAYALFAIGRLDEALYGWRRFLLLFLLGTAIATGASVAFSPHAAVGASGGVFALVGAVLAFGVRHKRALPDDVRRRLLRSMVWIVVLNLALGFSVQLIDQAAHVGGLVGGLILGFLLPPGRETRSLLGRGE